MYARTHAALAAHELTRASARPLHARACRPHEERARVRSTVDDDEETTPTATALMRRRRDAPFKSRVRLAARRARFTVANYRALRTSTQREARRALLVM